MYFQIIPYGIKSKEGIFLNGILKNFSFFVPRTPLDRMVFALCMFPPKCLTWRKSEYK